MWVRYALTGRYLFDSGCSRGGRGIGLMPKPSKSIAENTDLFIPFYPNKAHKGMWLTSWEG
jgi:hypothetical protein